MYVTFHIHCRLRRCRPINYWTRSFKRRLKPAAFLSVVRSTWWWKQDWSHIKRNMLGVKFLALCCGSIFHQKQLHPLSILRRSTPAVWNSLPATVLGSRSSSNSNFIFKKHLWSLLLVHLPGSLWKSHIALFGMLHLVYGTNSPLNFASLVRYSLLHCHLSHMAIHHLHHLHYYRLHLLLLAQSFILSFSANHFLHFPFLLDWFYGLWWYFRGYDFTGARGSNFPFSYWFLHGPYNSAALLRFLWY